jgi:hypothetical protein
LGKILPAIALASRELRQQSIELGVGIRLEFIQGSQGSKRFHRVVVRVVVRLSFGIAWQE